MNWGFVLLAIAMLGASALAWGGFTLLKRGDDRPKGWLMIVAAIVVVGNVLILTV